MLFLFPIKELALELECLCSLKKNDAMMQTLMLGRKEKKEEGYSAESEGQKRIGLGLLKDDKASCFEATG